MSARRITLGVVLGILASGCYNDSADRTAAIVVDVDATIIERKKTLVEVSYTGTYYTSQGMDNRTFYSSFRQVDEDRYEELIDNLSLYDENDTKCPRFELVNNRLSTTTVFRSCSTDATELLNLTEMAYSKAKEESLAFD